MYICSTSHKIQYQSLVLPSNSLSNYLDQHLIVNVHSYPGTIVYGTAQTQRRTRCSSRARTRLEPSSLQLESRSTLGLQQ